jgi:predicted N-acetyltransferase YhbS
MIIRRETAADVSAIYSVNEQAFGRPDEANLVDRLRANGKIMLSLVAVVNGRIVLGHPEYYPRFGFVRASQFGIRSSYNVPDEAFMALALKEGWLNGRAGVAHYQPEFDGV